MMLTAMLMLMMLMAMMTMMTTTMMMMLIVMIMLMPMMMNMMNMMTLKMMTKTRTMLRKRRSVGKDMEEGGEVFKGGARLVWRGGGGRAETGSRSCSRRRTLQNWRRGKGGGWPRS